MIRARTIACAASAAVAITTLVSCSDNNGSAPGGDGMTLFVAASMVDVMKELAGLYEDASDVECSVNAASTSTLARQLEHGARADVFVAANPQWMSHVVEQGIIDPASVRTLAHNRLVLIRSPHSENDWSVTSIDLTSDDPPNVERWAIGDPEHVPAGIYAREALLALGWWESIEPHVIPVVDVRAALRLVEIGEADLGIVYATDFAATNVITDQQLIPQQLHTPIRYELGAHVGSSPRANEFIEFCMSEQAQSVFESYGFVAIADAVEQP